MKKTLDQCADGNVKLIREILTDGSSVFNVTVGEFVYYAPTQRDAERRFNAVALALLEDTLTQKIGG